MAEITIIQLVTPNIDEYARYSVASVRKYAGVHGYRFLLQRSRTIHDLHINWTKIDFLKTALSDHSRKADNSYVVLLDADTVIINPERSIEYFIDRYGRPETDIFMAADTPFQLSSRKKPNAGFIIVRNNEVGRKIMDRWLHAAYNDGKKYNDTHPRNQLVYWNCVEPEYLRHQVVLPKKYFHKPLWWVPQPLKKHRFLYHVTSTGGKSRGAMMKTYYDSCYQDDQNLRETDDFLKDHLESIVSPL